MNRTDLSVMKRDNKGKNYARRLRREGKIPAVLYGRGNEPIPLAVYRNDLISILHGQEGHNTLLNMKFSDGAGQETLSMPKEIQMDTLSGEIVHVDFLQIHLDEVVTTEVPIHIVGSSPGVKAGGVLEFLLRELHIECLPMDIPSYVEVDVSGLQVGDSLQVSDIKVADNIRVLSDEHTAVVLIASPTIEKEPEEVEAEAAEAAEGAEAEGTDGEAKTE